MRRSAALLVSVAVLLSAGRAGAVITIYPRVGSQTDSTITPQGPGLVIMGGGGDVDRAFIWMHDTVVGSPSAAGADVVVLRATGDNGYDAYLAALAPFSSVQTLLIPTPASASDLSAAAAIVDKAEVVFFAGGNQADYVGWKGSSLLTAVARCWQRGGAVGGTSAGAAILGQFVYDGVAAAGSANVATADAVANPYEPTISFTRELLPFPVLDGTVTDPHFAVRDRFGRLAVFMARQLADGAASGAVHGIGVDEGTALCIDKHGLAVLEQYRAGTGSAFVVSGGPAALIQSGQPLRYPGLTVTRLDQQGQTYDVAHWCGTTTTYTVGVDGTMSPLYAPNDPYQAPGPAGTCNPTGPMDLGTVASDLGVAPADAGAGAPSDAGSPMGGDGPNGAGGAARRGCACRIGGRSTEASPATLLVGLAILIVRVRHRAATSGISRRR